MNKTIFCNVAILGETHFPAHFAVRTRYFLEYEGREYIRTFWTFFLDGYEDAIILN